MGLNHPPPHKKIETSPMGCFLFLVAQDGIYSLRSPFGPPSGRSFYIETLFHIDINGKNTASLVPSFDIFLTLIDQCLLLLSGQLGRRFGKISTGGAGIDAICVFRQVHIKKLFALIFG